MGSQLRLQMLQEGFVLHSYNFYLLPPNKMQGLDLWTLQ